MVSGYKLRAICRDQYGMNSYMWSPELESKMKELKRMAKKGGVSAMMKKVREETEKPEIENIKKMPVKTFIGIQKNLVDFKG